MLDFNHITFQFPEDEEAMFEDLSFHVEQGEFISIIGKSGIGKSTIFRLINGLLTPQKGSILFEGKPIESMNHYSGFMPQKDLLFPWRSIGENLMLPMELQSKKLSKKDRIRKAKNLLTEVGLADYYDKFPKDLSGGMRQRVSFARTLLTDCELLLLDEPFSALDALTRMELQEWTLKQWYHFKRTILLVTHDVEEALFLSTKIFLISEHPATKIQEFSLSQEYPRKREQLDTPKMKELKEHLIQQLRMEDAK